MMAEIKKINLEKIQLIDKVYIVNLAVRVDRREKWKGQLQHLPELAAKLVFFEAVDGSKIENNTALRNGELGCSSSHITIWKQAISNNYNYILVFEDDVLIDASFEAKLNSLLTEINMEFDWFYLYNSWDYRPCVDYSANIEKVIASLGTVGYILNLKAVNRLLPYVEEFNFPVDVIMGHMSFLSAVYRPKKVFVRHDENSESNVQKKIKTRSLIERLKNKLGFR